MSTTAMYPSHTPHSKAPSHKASRRLQAVPSLGPWERSRPWFAGDYKGAVEKEREASQARALTAPAWFLTHTTRKKKKKK